MEKIVEISSQELENYIKKWNENKDIKFEQNKIYCEDNGTFIAVDNTTQNCWTEEFKTEKEAINWLANKEL